MTPSVDTRIKAIIGALEHLVLPALEEADADPIVQEQAALSLGHLKIIAMQLPYLEAYHGLCLDEQLRLAREMLDASAGGEATQAATRALADIVAGIGDLDADTREKRNRVADAVSQLVIASSHDADPAFIAASQESLIAHGQRQTRRDRAWYGASLLDPHLAELPSIPELIAEETLGREQR